MTEDATIIGGIVFPSTDLVFLAVVIGLQIPLGITHIITRASAMRSEKRRGQPANALYDLGASRPAACGKVDRVTRDGVHGHQRRFRELTYTQRACP